MFRTGRLIMNNENYIVATIRSWNIKIYNEVIKHYPGHWHLISEKDDLNKDTIKKLNPRYIFFPHWSHIVPKEILDISECICFHETDLPYGRGGSPIQNLIAHGHNETLVSALQMVEELDAGPIYFKRKLSLEGLAEEIYNRAAIIIAEMIKVIISEQPQPDKQEGEPIVFKRRKPHESKIPSDLTSYKELFDHIRMLDASGYPRAFMESGGFKFEIYRPALRTEGIVAEVFIKKSKNRST